tara:strand:+ start:124 stop:1035 length:912 start_codon:yes stop_codon:yes gene_type:complete
MTRTIVSWDVGIKNLAYCIIKDDGGKFSIVKWDIINISNQKIIKCCQKMKKKKGIEKQCTSNAKFYIEENGKIIGYCARHKKNYQPFELNWKDEYFVKKKTENKCCYIGKKKCEKNSTYYSPKEETYYCTAHSKSRIKQIEREKMLKKVKKKSCMSETVFSLSKIMTSKLDNIKELMGADEILIENQPTLKNPTMKTVSSFLFNYFMIRGIIDKEKTKSKIKIIKFISPSNKLKVNEDNTIDVMNKNKDPEKKYKLTKELGIKYTKMLIKNMPDKLTHLSNYKKKDDLCDAFLQGYHYMYYRS